MSAVRLYSPFYVLIVWTVLIAFGLDSSAPTTALMLIMLAVAIGFHVSELVSRHTERFHRRPH